MHPAIVVLTIASFILIPLLNIKYTIIIMIFFSIIVPLNQRVEISSFTFHVFRLLILAGWIKIIFNKNLKFEKIEKTDKAIICWVIVSFTAYIIQNNNISAVINRLGFAYNAIGTYFLYRIMFRRKEDISTVFDALVIISVIVAIFMLNEQRTGKNLLNVFGAHEYVSVRMGNIRSQGPFGHSILAGIFGATMLPLSFSMWRHKWGSPFFGIIGTLAAITIIIISFSTTSLVAGVSGFVALLFWPLRNHMRIVRYSILFLSVALKTMMISPLWVLIKEISFVKGSTSWHRFALVDNLIKRFDEWFLFGSSSIEKWGYLMDDRANQYYLEAVTGGILKLVFFIMIILFSFNIIGRNIRITTDAPSQKKFWALGSALFANVVGFIGSSLWDQSIFVWYLLLALITSACLVDGEKHLAVDDIYKKSGEKQRIPSQYKMNV